MSRLLVLILATVGLLTGVSAQQEVGGQLAHGVEVINIDPPLPPDRVAVTVSSEWAHDQGAHNLVDGSGFNVDAHDNNGFAATMWHTTNHPTATEPAPGLPASPAWARFDFPEAQRFDSVAIWNHNQIGLTDRGFHKAHLYGSADGQNWFPLTSPGTIEIPRAAGLPNETAITFSNVANDQDIRSVIVAADAVDGNYGGNCYGLCAVRFCVRPLSKMFIPSNLINVSVSSLYSETQALNHLIDGSGLVGGQHDANFAADTMWHTVVDPQLTVPTAGLVASPGWVRFDFLKPVHIGEIQIWNHNQKNLTNRGFNVAHIYATQDGEKWFVLTSSPTVTIPQGIGAAYELPAGFENADVRRAITSVIIAADQNDGNYGGDCYGLCAVRFLLPHGGQG